MKQKELQRKSIEALRSFNNTIVTSRLYPPEAPQVTHAVERGYEAITTFLEQHGNLQFTLKENFPFLCGLPLEQEVQDSFPNLVVYRQLRHLQLANLVIDPEMDRFAFTQILSVFCASLEKIRDAGGGAEYITGLGLAAYFPEQAEPHGGGENKAVPPGAVKTNKAAKVQPELVACLFGRDRRAEVETRLRAKMVEKENVFQLLGAGISYILQDIQKKKVIAASPHFPILLKRIEELVEQENHQEITTESGPYLVENFNEPSLLVLLAQDYHDDFGKRLYEGLIKAISSEALSRIIVLLRDKLARAKSAGGEDSSSAKFLANVLLRLVTTEKGKHVLSAEKVKEVIHRGEKQRKKQRLEAGFRGLLQGDTGFLNSIELVEYLPKAVQLLFEGSGTANVALILDAMAQKLRSGEGAVQDSLLKSAIIIGEYLIDKEHWHLVDILLEPLVEKVMTSETGDARLEKTLTLLELVMQHSWQSGENDRGDSVMTLFHQIRSGQIKKAESVVAMVGKVQDKGIRRTELPKMLLQCLKHPTDEIRSRRLLFQGPVAIRFLVDSLISAEKMVDRMKIIDLLTSGDVFLPQIIHERLPAHMPWYGKRNLIKLLGESGSEEDAESVLPYLHHDDPRVQREAFLCIYRIGGARTKQLLLAALDDTNETLMLQIIAGLVSFCDDEVAGRLSELLATHNRFSEKNQQEIIRQLLETLGRCPCEAALQGVQDFLMTKGQKGAAVISPKNWELADKTCGFLEETLHEKSKKHHQASKIRSAALRLSVGGAGKRGEIQRVITGLPQEQAIRNLISQGDVSAAIDQLLQLIEKTARMRNFHQAEKLRQWLVEIDATAFNRILKAAEIINREKTAAVDKSHLEKWNSLYDFLGTGEFNALYHSLLHKKYGDGEIIVNQGTLQNALFFINSGKVKLYFNEQGDEVLVNTLAQGQIFGTGVFFAASVWTISVASVGLSEISILKWDKLRESAKEFPELESKLYDFCKQFEETEQFIERSLADRRSHERHRITGRISTTLLYSSEDRGGVDSKVELYDISQGGVCYLARFSTPDNARLLLGRKVEVRLPSGFNTKEMTRTIGDILAVKTRGGVEGEYFVHVSFAELMEKRHLDEVITAIRRDAQVI